MIGKIISHYKITEKLGEGGMGEVYLADDTKLKRQVAIKFLPEYLTKDKENVERFEREAEAAAALNHPNIVTIYDVIEEDGHLCIVMEYIEGKTLRDLLIPNSQFQMPNAKDIISQLCEGLSKAHKSGIVHRDIKPENIIIDYDGRVKILDFGLAKLKGVSKLTKETSTLGTIHYMSPEQIQGKDVDQRSDIWSVGIVLYEMLTGEPPFKGDYESAVQYAILNENPETINDDVSNNMVRVINNCLKKNPQERYGNIEELNTDLQKEEDESKAPKTDSSKQRMRYILPLFSILIISIIVIGYFLKPHSDSNKGESGISEWENSIAVLPFMDMSPDKDQEWFCDDITDQIISALQKLRRIKVIGRKAVMHLKGSEKTNLEIGQELNVTNILESSASKIGDRIRIRTKLISSRNEAYLWSESYDYPYRIDSIFAIYDDISEKIAINLLATLSPQEKVDLKTEKPSNTEAYEYYTKGRFFHFNKYFSSFNLEDFHTSEQMFLKAIELDSNFALAYAGIADLYHSHFRFTAPKDEKQTYLDMVEFNIMKAYKADQTSAYINRVMGSLIKEKGDIETAFEWYKKAYQLDPNSWDSNNELGAFYRRRGLLSLAVKYITKAIEIDPILPQLYSDRGILYWNLGQLEIAEVDFIKALEIKSNHWSGLSNLTYLYISLKRYDEAEKFLRLIAEKYPDRDTSLFYAFLYASKGQKEKALDLYKGKDFYLFLMLDMSDEALNELRIWTDKEFQEKCSHFYLLKNDQDLINIRSDPRFQEILAKHKELYEENLAKYGDIDI